MSDTRRVFSIYVPAVLTVATLVALSVLSFHASVSKTPSPQPEGALSAVRRTMYLPSNETLHMIVPVIEDAIGRIARARAAGDPVHAAQYVEEARGFLHEALARLDDPAPARDAGKGDFFREMDELTNPSDDEGAK